MHVPPCVVTCIQPLNMTSFQMEPHNTAPPQGNINIKGKLSNSVNKGAACPKFGMDRRHHPARFLFSTRSSARNSCPLAQTPSQQPCFKDSALGIGTSAHAHRDIPHELHAVGSKARRETLAAEGSLWDMTLCQGS